MNCSIAVMQPYLFPYIGYFQLIHAVDVFVFYDDVNFINKGWINRNKFMIDGQEQLFTIPLQGASQNKRICDILVLKDKKWEAQLFKTLKQNYSKAPYYNEVSSMVKNVFNTPYETIADLAIESVKQISNYLEIPTLFEVSSMKYSETQGLDKADRLIAIVQQKGCKRYINPAGGRELYKKTYFSERGVELIFIENELIPYTQFNKPSLVGLSIIDVLMFNNFNEVNGLLNKYKII